MYVRFVSVLAGTVTHLLCVCVCVCVCACAVPLLVLQSVVSLKGRLQIGQLSQFRLITAYLHIEQEQTTVRQTCHIRYGVLVSQECQETYVHTYPASEIACITASL